MLDLDSTLDISGPNSCLGFNYNMYLMADYFAQNSVELLTKFLLVIHKFSESTLNRLRQYLIVHPLYVNESHLKSISKNSFFFLDQRIVLKNTIIILSKNTFIFFS